MIWYILIIFFIAILTWIVLGPVILKLNTDRNQYQLMLPGVIKARVLTSQDLIHIRGWIFFVPFRLDLSKLNKGRGKKRGEKDKKKKKTRKRSGSLRMIRSIPGAFQIRRLWLDLDTDDFMLNVWLIPSFSALNKHRNIQMQVNFEGHLFMDLDLRTRIASLLWVIIKNR
jgi:hypothetical protein